MKSFFRVKFILIFLATLFLFKAVVIFADTNFTAFVPPKSSNFQFTLDSDNKDQILNQGISIPYTITYGASVSAGTNSDNTISVDYSDDLISGINVFDYITGSASNGYGNSIPVVDIINRKITWQILSLPPGIIDQLLTFNMRTNGDYRGESTVNFKVKADMNNQYATFSQLELAKTYAYATPTPGATPTIFPTTSPAPTPSSSGITDVFFNGVSNNSGEISVTTNSPSKIAVYYGTKINSLTSVQTASFSTTTKIILDDLKPDTIYFIRITSVDEEGNRTTSEIFTFKTAKAPSLTKSTKSIFVLSSRGNILQVVTLGPGSNQDLKVTLPENVPLEISYTLASSENIKQIEIVLRNKNILGINTYSTLRLSNLLIIPMVEKESGIYYALIPPIADAGHYELLVRISEKSGNIYEQKVSEVKSTLPIRILEAGSNYPLYGARAYFYFYNISTNRFEPITQNYSNMQNPEFADSQGIIQAVFPKGKYKVEVSTLFHKGKAMEFSIDSNVNYPVIYLEKNPFDIFSTLNYIRNTFYDSSNNLRLFMDSSSLLIRYFNILASLIIVTTIFLAFLLFAFKTHVKVRYLPLSFYHHMHASIPGQTDIIFGRVISEDRMPISRADIFVLSKSGKVIYHTVTNKKGIFAYNSSSADSLQVIKEGYEEMVVPKDRDSHLGIKLVRSEEKTVLENRLIKGAQSILGLLFESVMVLSLILEYIFSLHFGVILALPFIILSFGNILLWLFYMREGKNI